MSNLNDLAPESIAPQAVTIPPEVDTSLDDEMREVVLKFEEIYAELAPTIEDESQPERLRHDVFDLPDDIGKALQDPPPPDPVPLRPRMRREPGLASRPAMAGSPPASSAAKEETFDIDEALSILRAAEMKGRVEAREAKDKDDDTVQPFAMPVTRKVSERSEPVLAAAPTSRAVEADQVRPADEWSAKSSNFWSIALIAASIALIVGTGVGYMMGRGQEALAPVAKIKTLPDGGAKLRPDYDLRSR